MPLRSLGEVQLTNMFLRPPYKKFPSEFQGMCALCRMLGWSHITRDLSLRTQRMTVPSIVECSMLIKEEKDKRLFLFEPVFGRYFDGEFRAVK